MAPNSPPKQPADELDDSLAPEDRVVDDDLVLQRYNSQLPSSYRHTLDREQKLFLRALHVLHESLATSGTPPPSTATQNDEELVAEGYQHHLERDLAAFEKGLCRYLELKHALEPQDYGKFLNLLLRGVLSKTVDMGLRSKLARCASRLLSKRQCELPDGVQWRPIMEQLKRIHIDCVDGGPFIGREVRDAHCRNLLSLLGRCANFLQPTDSPELIWQHFLPRLRSANPDVQFESALLMCHVLPTRGDSWTGWLPDGMALWRSLDTSPDWDSIWMGTASRVARQQPCIVDWTDNLPWIYYRISASFQLPLGTTAPQGSADRRCPHHLCFLQEGKTVPHAASFVIYSLSPQYSEASKFLTRLFALIANYFHPSNTGRWSAHIGLFLGHVASALATRVIDERNATKAGAMDRVIGNVSQRGVAPASHRLTDDMINSVVDMLLPLTELGLHSKSPTMTTQAAAASRDLSIICQDKVIPSLLGKASEGLESISSPHRTTAALKLLAALTPIFLDFDLFPIGLESLPQALMLTLPGIDPNDPGKTEHTLRFVAGSFARIQGRLSTDDFQIPVDFLEEYVQQLLERMFDFLDSLEAPPKKNSVSGYAGSLPFNSFLFSLAVENVFGALPPSVAISASRCVVKKFTSSSCVNGLKSCGAMVRFAASAAAVASGGSSADIFIPSLLKQVLDRNGTPSDASSSKHSLAAVGEDELVWRIRMLAQACRSVGSGLDPYLKDISEVIKLAFDRPARAVYKAGGRLLRGALEGLTATRMLIGSQDVEGSDKELHSFSWHLPSDEDWKLAEGLLDDFISQAERHCFGQTGDGGKTKITADRDTLFRVIRLLHAAQRGGRWLLSGSLPDHYAELGKLVDEAVPMSTREAKLALKMPVCAGLGGERQESQSRMVGENQWNRIFTLVLQVLQHVITSCPDDGALLYRCLEPLELAHEPFRRAVARSIAGRQALHTSRSYKDAYKAVVASKRPFGSEGGVGRTMPRFIVKLRIEAHHEMRLSIAARAGMCSSKLCEDIVSQLTDVALDEFPRVRGEAKSVLSHAFRIIKPAVRKRELLRILAALETSKPGTVTSNGKIAGTDAPVSAETIEKSSASGVSSENKMYARMMGASSLLRSSAAAPLIMRDVELFKLSISALLAAMPRAERPDAAASVGALFGKLCILVRPLGIGTVQLIGSDLVLEQPGAQRTTSDDPDRLLVFNSLIDHLVGMVEKSDVENTNTDQSLTVANGHHETHWRVQSLVATVLYILLREDRPPSATVARFFMKSVVSDVVALRQISTRAIALILALHGRKAANTNKDVKVFNDSPAAWGSSGNQALQAIGELVCSPSFCQKLVHTLALDQDDDSSEARRNAGPGALAFANMGVASDGDASWMFTGGKAWPSSWVPRSRDSLNILRVRFYEALLRVYGASMYKSLLPTLEDTILRLDGKEEKIIDGVKNEDVRVVAAEILAGVCRGLNVAHCESVGAVQKAVSLAQVLLNDMTGSVGSVNGAALIRFVSTAEDVSIGDVVVDKLLEWLLESKPIIKPMDDGVHAHLQARRLRYLHSCVADIDDTTHPRLTLLGKACLGPLMQTVSFNHELKTVREEVARLLALLAVSVPDECVGMFEDNMLGLIRRLQEGGTSDKVVQSTSEEGEDHRKIRSRQGETLSRFLSVVYWNGRARRFEKFISPILLPLLQSFDESDPERISTAMMGLSLSAQGVFAPSTIESIIENIEKARKDARWKVRGAIPSFLNFLSFCSLFTADQRSLSQVRDIVIHLLSDSQLEVRQVAANSFVTMIRDAPAEAVEEVRQRCMNVLSETAPRRRGKKKETLDGEKLFKRHGAVLGLSSLVTSSPYTVPEWMPSVLVGLSGCVNDPPPISTCVRDLYADFMRTHRDEWQSHKQAFTTDELEIVSELFISPSYYA